MSTQYISQINDLIEINLDAHKGYQEAFVGVNDLELKKIFKSYSTKRQKNAYDLKNQVRLLGDQPVQSGSVVAALHRAWMDFKSDVLSNKEEAILEECIRGEQAAIKTYEEVLGNKIIAASLRGLIQNQLREIREACRQMKEWKKVIVHETEMA